MSKETKEYAIYPFDYMRITQRHDWVKGNHLAHWYPNANYSDKPWDEGCKDGGQSYFVPKNDYKVVEIIGLGTTVYTNSVRLETCNKVKIYCQEEPVILELTLTHMTEECIKSLKVGQIIHKGEKKIWEGKDGADAYHFHITANIGYYAGFKHNSNDKYVFAYKKSLLPNEAYYVDDSVKILDANGYKFEKAPKEAETKVLGTPVSRNTKVRQIEVLADNLRARKEANGDALGYIKKGIYNILEEKKAGDYNWIKVESNLWIAYSSNWAKIYEKEEVMTEPKIDPITEPITEVPTVPPTEPLTSPPTEPTEDEEESKENIIKTFIKALIEFLKKLFRV